MEMWVFFFFKQKTAYELCLGDWSSDVCSSDLLHWAALRQAPFGVVQALRAANREGDRGKDGCGNHPLHWAALRQAPLEVVQALVGSDAERVREECRSR